LICSFFTAKIETYNPIYTLVFLRITIQVYIFVIIDKKFYKKFEKIFIGGGVILGMGLVAEMVKEEMVKRKEFSPYTIYKEIKNKLGSKRMSYASFYFHYIYIPRKLGLITYSRKPKKPFQRAYYKVVKSMLDSPMWSNPQKYYNPLTFLGRSRYAEIKSIARSKKKSIVDVLFEEFPELVEEVAEVRGLTVEELRKKMKKKEFA